MIKKSTWYCSLTVEKIIASFIVPVEVYCSDRFTFHACMNVNNALQRVCKKHMVPGIGIITVHPYKVCSSSNIHISTARRLRIRAIWCEPYFAVKKRSRFSFTSPFSSEKPTCRFDLSGLECFMSCEAAAIIPRVLRGSTLLRPFGE